MRNLIILSVTIFAILANHHVNSAATPKKAGEPRQLLGAFGPIRNYCPLCDDSVYSYCVEKVLHDSCCCRGQFGVQGSLNCFDADCTYLHANSCHEHALIAECCCDD